MRAMTDNITELKPGIRINNPAYEPPEKLLEDMEALVKMLLSGEITGFACVYETKGCLGHIISRGTAELANLLTAMELTKDILKAKYRGIDRPENIA